MRQSLTCARTVLIEDLDGVHWFDEFFHSSIAFYEDTKRELMAALLPLLSVAEVARIGKESYLQTGDGIAFFPQEAQKHGLDADVFRESLYARYYALQRQKLLTRNPNVFAPCAETIESFQALSSLCTFSLLTHSHLETWAAPLLTDIGHIGFFPEDRRMGAVQIEYSSKKLSPAPIEEALRRAGAAPQQAVFLEDSLDNLKCAKETGAGSILTVYIHNGRPLDGLPDYVDMQAGTLLEFNRAARAVHEERPRIRRASRANRAAGTDLKL